ncbi:hypothetical protein GIB67_042855, partial [Kingdonia uniflora]
LCSWPQVLSAEQICTLRGSFSQLDRIGALDENRKTSLNSLWELMGSGSMKYQKLCSLTWRSNL